MTINCVRCMSIITEQMLTERTAIKAGDFCWCERCIKLLKIDLTAEKKLAGLNEPYIN